jgi:multiple sugar transport system permease protein
VRRRSASPFALGLLGLWSLVVAFPLYWLVTASFKDALAIHQGPTFVPWVDFQPTADAWTRLAAGAEGEMVGGPLLNSVLVGGTSSLLAMALGASAAYGLARARVRLGPMANEDILFWMVSQRLMPPIVTALALFLMLRTVALLDTRTGLLLVYVAFNLPLATWLMYNFLRHVPASVEEAAWVDGASRGQALVHVLLPVSLPGLVATFLFCFMFAWNEFLFALVLTFNRARTLPILIAAQHSQKGIEWWSLSAMSLITLAPVVLITLLLQRYLVAQVLRGSEG